jgi:hypothetical protein
VTKSTEGAASLLLPEGTRLIHIGPPKTGTTSLQGAFHGNREALLAQGVRYAGSARHSRRAVYAAERRPEFQHEHEPPPLRLWTRLLAEIRNATEPRVVLSSEIFADAAAEAIPRIVADLDPSRVHVVVTLRPLARILSSQWQQAVRGGVRASFDAWLRDVLEDPGAARDLFWHRHHHDRLIARWADVVGYDRVTVVVVDEVDHDVVLRVFEQLLGLREGTLVAERDRANRSMTLPEVEAVRAFNKALRAEGLGGDVLHRVRPFASYMKDREPRPDEPRIETPQWALDRATEIAGEIVANIAASGVRVVGDLASLAAPRQSSLAGDRQPEACLPPDVAGALVMGVLVGSGLARRDAPRSDLWIEWPELSRIPTRQLVGVVARRSRAAAARRLRHLGRGRS